LTVAVLGLNLSVTAMDYQFSALVLRNFPSTLNGVSFSVESLCRPFCSRATNGPSVLVRHDMLIAFGAHYINPVTAELLLTFVCGALGKPGHSH
jgi:hypothetical protein